MFFFITYNLLGGCLMLNKIWKTYKFPIILLISIIIGCIIGVIYGAYFLATYNGSKNIIKEEK